MTLDYDTLDFSGGKDSWFDLWHDHVDWEGTATPTGRLD